MKDHPRSGYRAWIVFLLFSGTLINAIDRAGLSIAAPAMIKDLGLNAAEMGVVLSSFFWPYLFCNIFAGGLVDRFGAKTVMGWAALIWSLFSALTGAVHTRLHLILARIGVGVGESASFPVNAKVVNSNFPSEQRGTVTGWYTAGLRLGFTVCPLIMAYLQSLWGWRSAFYITGVCSLGWAVLWFFTYTEHKDVELIPAAPHPAVPWKALLTDRGLYGLLLAKFFQDYLFYFFVTWLPGYLVMAHGFSLAQMATYGSLMWLAGFCSQPLVGWFSDFLVSRGFSMTQARKGCIVTMMLCSSVVIAVGFTKSFTICVTLLVLAVACESAATTMLWTICTELAPQQQAGSIAGVMNAAGAVAGILAPSITGLLLYVTGNFKGALVLAGIMVLMAASSVVFIIPPLCPVSLNEAV